MSQTKNGQKLSRREREEQKITRRYMMIGGGIVGLAGLGTFGLSMAVPAFSELDGSGTIDERLAKAGVTDHPLRLTPQTPSIDVMIIGTSDCVHCRALVAKGIDDLEAHAQKNGYGLAYAPIGYSESSLGTTRLLNALPDIAMAAPAHILKSVYEGATDLNSGKSMDEVMAAKADELGAPLPELQALMAKDPVETTKAIQALTKAFPVVGTPMIFVNSKATPSKVTWFNGFSDPAALIRQVEAAQAEA